MTTAGGLLKRAPPPIYRASEVATSCVRVLLSAPEAFSGVILSEAKEP